MGFSLPVRLSGAPRLARRALSFSALAALLPLAVACDNKNPFRTIATTENIERQTPVFALTGSPIGYPTAFKFTTESLVRPEVLASGTVNFDIAFDLTADNRVILYPVKQLVPQPPGGSPSVGLLKSSSTFDAIARAPDKGYTNDSSLVVSPKEVVLVKLPSAGCIYGDPYYAKMQIDTILPTERRMILRTLVNRNCGYRDLIAGVPKN
jgi:hypothetical protein